MKTKIAVCVALAVFLQTVSRKVWEPLEFLDLPLIVVVYFALRRDPVQAVVIGTVAGIASDFFSVGLLGANGFSKTVTAFLISALATRVLIDNQIFRIPILAGAAALDAVLYVFLHRLFGQEAFPSFAEMVAYKVMGTTVGGTILVYFLDTFFSDKARQRRQFAFRRRIARRTLGRRKY